MNPAIKKAITEAVQEAIDHAVKMLRVNLNLKVASLRGEKGMFLLDVRPDKADVPSEQIRGLLALVENDLEEEHQGLRLMLLPARYRADKKAKSRTAGGKQRGKVSTKGKD
jgi:hypothetical protein